MWTFSTSGIDARNLEQLLEVEDRELARFPVVRVEEQAAATRGPGVGNRHAFPAEKMPRFGRRADGVLEAVADAVHEQEDLLPGRQRQPLQEHAPGSHQRLFPFGEDLGCRPDEPPSLDPEEVRCRRQAPQLGDRVDPKRGAATARRTRRAVVDELLP